MASTYISRTFSGTYNKGTISMWLKRSALGSQYIFYNESSSDSNDYGLIQFDSSDRIEFMTVTNGTHTQKLITSRKFRDTSAFYHFVFAMDTDNSTADNRLRIYVNGVEETAYDTRDNGSQGDTNYMFQTSATNKHRMFASAGGSACFDGLATHIHIVPNSQLAATVFGEFDSTSGIWVPKTSPSVTYTAQGAFLKFENSGNMDLDSSGNNLTFTTSGTLTQNTDTPTNNACTLNGVSNEASGFTLANGNLSATYSSGDWETIQGTIGVNKGKWYYETKWNGSGAYMAGWTSVNFMNASPVNYVGHTHSEPSYAIQASDGSIYYSTSSAVTQDDSGWGDTFTSSDIIGCAIDIDNGKLYWSKNGTWMNSGDPTSGSTGTGAFSISDTATNYFWNPVMSSYNGAQGMFNFGSGYFGTTQVSSANADANGYGAFEYAVPSGYYALNTKNIKEFG